MEIIESYGETTAYCDHMPGPDEPGGRLRVTVNGTFRTGGCSATLTETEGNTGTGTVLKLDLNLQAPEGPAPEVLTPFTVMWPPEGEDPSPGLEYSDVEFRVVGTDDEAPDMVRVEHLETSNDD